MEPGLRVRRPELWKFDGDGVDVNRRRRGCGGRWHAGHTAATACWMCCWIAASNSCCCCGDVMLWPGWECWIYCTTTIGGERTLPPIHNSNNVKKCLREVPGVTGADFEFFMRHQRTELRKKNDGGVCRSAAHGTAVPDGTGWNGRRKECQLCDETTTTQHG